MVAGLGVLFEVPFHADPGDDIIPLEGWRYLTAWAFDPMAVLLVILPVALYLMGVRTLHKRGDHWPIYRTISFCVLGMGAIAVGLCSFLGVYDTVLFWLHMVQHMLFNMVGPVFLAVGAPVTLALRALPKKPRAWLLRFLHSFFAKAILFPPFTTFLMVASPFALYMTGWYEFTLRDDLAHDFLHGYMILIGTLFFVPLLGVDPVPIKMPYPIRLLLFFLTMPFHAFLGVTIMGAEKLIAEEWYLSFGRAWGLNPLDDQVWAGALMWATGDLTSFAAMITIFVQWVSESNREAKRMDRALDREEARQSQVSSQPRVGYDASTTDDAAGDVHKPEEP